MHSMGPAVYASRTRFFMLMLCMEKIHLHGFFPPKHRCESEDDHGNN
jgi:hypothetical protein